MLVLSRRSQESVVVGGTSGVDRMLKVTVLEIKWRKGATGFRRSIRHSCSSNGSVGTNPIECSREQLETGVQNGCKPA